MLGLIFIGLVAVAGFTVLAQRRLRALGMLGSLGAADRNVAWCMTANGAIVGRPPARHRRGSRFRRLVRLRPHLETSAGHRIDPLHLPWWVIAAAMAPRRRDHHRGLAAAGPRGGPDVRRGRPGRAAGAAEAGAPLAVPGSILLAPASRCCLAVRWAQQRRPPR